MIKTNIITDCDMSAITETLDEIYNKHRVLEVKFCTDTSEFNMYYTVFIVYEVNENEQNK